MDSEVRTNRKCVFCGASKLLHTHSGLFHPLRKSHGPFDFYVCSRCGSGLTLPPPSPESLRELYGSFQGGLPEFHRQITQDDPQVGITHLCVRRLAKLSGRRPEDRFCWIDVGAGGGELSAALSKRFPNSRGIAVDLHERPRLLDGLDATVQWIRADINAADFASHIASQISSRADAVFSISVWEHVTAPDSFVENLIRLLAKPGLIYLLAPNYASPMRKILRDCWPYFTPGEHLFMPSTRGARACLNRAWTTVSGADADVRIEVRPITLPYTIRYVAQRLRIPGGRFVPKAWRIPFPAGALEAFLKTT